MALNSLFQNEDYTVMCQYNRERFPPEVLEDVIETHPHLIHDNVVSHNVYYTPPEEFFGPEQPADKVDRMMGKLREQTERKEHEQAKQRLYEIVADSDRPFDDKLQAVLELGCERFDLEYGGIARIDPTADLFEVETILGDHDHLVPGKQYSLSETYCQLVADDGETAAVTDPVSEGFEGKTIVERLGRISQTARTILQTSLV